MSKLSPVLKWAGGKRQLLPAIMPLVPQEYESDKDLMDECGIAHFDEKTIKYYEELVKHLGSSSRYQLLGSLFANKTIRGMDNRIPAIQGKMGGYTYYAFSIQPEILLKIGYVLHRSEANEGMMPTYQRIIKKARLKSVHEFIENKGFFPNSLLISVDTKKKRPMQFDLSDKQGSDGVTKLGILHLPNEYRSAYIIDGQHRLYGYSDSKYAKTNSIPVVAFENMDQKEQVKLFMEINENQKAVSKNLRNTLNADLLWVSDNPIERREALRSRIAQDLGDKELRASYGGNGPKDYWRNLERAIHNAHEEFIPEGYVKYWEDHDKSHNEDSIRIMAAVEDSARKFIVSTLKASSANWIQTIPKKVYTNASNDQSKHKYDSGEELAIEQFFSMADLSDIIQYGPNWSTYFEKVFTLPSEAKKTGGKKAKTEWMVTIDKLQRNVGRANFVVSKQQREMLLGR